MDTLHKYKNTKKHINFMLFYILAVYIPFFIVLSINYDITIISLSKIGWRAGGPIFLILFAVLTIPFMLYEVFFFIEYFGKKNKFLAIFSIVGVIFLIMGMSSPFRITDPPIFHVFHNVFSMIGSICFFSVANIAVIQNSLANKHRKVLIFILLGILNISMFIMYLQISSVSLFEMLAALSCLVAMYLVNRTFKDGVELAPQLSEVQEEITDVSVVSQ